VEVTGPTYKKMTINALNSGAKAWLADQEDANTPAVGFGGRQGQINLLDAHQPGDRLHRRGHRGQGIQACAPDADQLPTIMVRPRGWHMNEKHMLIDGEQASGSLVDFALYFATAGQRPDREGPAASTTTCPRWSPTSKRDCGMTSSNFAEDALRATRAAPSAPRCLIETYPAAFQMWRRFLYELREHSAGLNAGRWDYIFSVIKTHRNPAGRTGPSARPFGPRDHDRALHARLYGTAGAHLP
jgi:malate synthase